MMSAPMKNLRKARVKGCMFSSDHLKSGGAAPQIKLAIISASIAFCLADIFFVSFRTCFGISLSSG